MPFFAFLNLRSIQHAAERLLAQSILHEKRARAISSKIENFWIADEITVADFQEAIVFQIGRIQHGSKRCLRILNG
jgi:hypothetical protein